MKRWMVVLACAACACGSSGSGVDGDKRLTALGDSEIRELCEYIVDVFGPPRTIDCGTGTITVGGMEVSPCIAQTIELQARYPMCEATVDDTEACAEALASFDDVQLCSGDVENPAACDPLSTVECGGG